VISNAPGDTVSTTIVSGINQVSITNTALGQLEICKDMILSDAEYQNFVFSFSYKNTDPSVNASGTTTASPSRCSPPIKVPVGTYQITENITQTTTTGGTSLPKAFSFVSSTATGPTGDNRCSPVNNSANPNCGNPITVTVPYFNPNKDPILYGETTVFFTDKVNRSTVKICKVVETGSTTPLAGQAFTFNVFANGTPIPSSGTLATTVTNGTCTGLLTGAGGLGVPVIQPNGTATTIAVEEVHNGPFKPSSMTVDNTTSTFPCSTPTAPAGTNPDYTVCWTAVTGNSVLTVTNRYFNPV
jgi:hypothetical protein